MLLKNKPPLVLGHRGASAQAPENTLAAFQLAAQQQADGIELDVQFSADREIIVFHDDTLDRLTNSTGRVAQHTLAALKKLDVGAKFGASYQGEKIPTLAEVFHQIAPNLLINIEIKNFSDPFNHLPDEVAKSIQQNQAAHPLLISSFNPIALYRFHRVCPSIPIGLLTVPGAVDHFWVRVFKRLLPLDAVHPYFLDVNAQLIRKAHQNQWQVNTYTVNAPAEMHRLFNLGIDSIISDDPLLARQTLNEFLQEQPQ